MKLKTKLSVNKQTYARADVFHDTMAANALMQALSEVPSGDAQDYIARADELMREWCFGG